MIQKLIALYLSFISVLNLLLPFPTSFIGELRLVVPEDWELYGYIESGGDISFYHPKSMEASTQYTLPYWLGRYHGMLSA